MKTIYRTDEARKSAEDGIMECLIAISNLSGDSMSYLLAEITCKYLSEYRALIEFERNFETKFKREEEC